VFYWFPTTRTSVVRIMYTFYPRHACNSAGYVVQLSVRPSVVTLMYGICTDWATLYLGTYYTNN